jgi:hypothetical protein
MAQRDHYLEPCCDDPLSWHYRPGSTYRHTFDCETCNSPYEVVVDETGYVNQPAGLMASGDQIDMFVAGDSVLQGLGVPSVMEFLRDQFPVTLWNLSLAGYGPRQKISALIAYALPKHPKWLVVEFYPNNDVADTIVADVCEGIQDFRYCYWTIEPAHRIMRHPLYSTMAGRANNIFEILKYYAAQNFTLATTRYIIATLKTTLNALKGTLKRRLTIGIDRSVPRSEGKDHLEPPKIKFVDWVKHTRPQRGKLLDWAIASMPLVYGNYERLAAKVAEMENKPQVILLYHPTPYELYHDILTDRNADYDRIADFLKSSQRAFAEKHGWVFLDLTAPLRHELQANKIWLYGRYDPTHWSHEGTTLVASVLKAELLKVIDGGDVSPAVQ